MCSDYFDYSYSWFLLVAYNHQIRQEASFRIRQGAEAVRFMY